MEPAESVDVPVSLFSRFYRAHIRVRFDWDRLEREQWPIRMSVIDDPLDLREWSTPWYLRGDKDEVGYGDDGAKPLRLGDFPGVLQCLSEKRRTLIQTLGAAFNNSRQPVQVSVPVYSLGRRGSLLLDGNHRLAALVTTGKAFKLMAFTVYGPLDPEVLPDVAHWMDGC